MLAVPKLVRLYEELMINARKNEVAIPISDFNKEALGFEFLGLLAS